MDTLGYNISRTVQAELSLEFLCTCGFHEKYRGKLLASKTYCQITWIVDKKIKCDFRKDSAPNFNVKYLLVSLKLLLKKLINQFLDTSLESKKVRIIITFLKNQPGGWSWCHDHRGVVSRVIVVIQGVAVDHHIWAGGLIRVTGADQCHRDFRC